MKKLLFIPFLLLIFYACEPVSDVQEREAFVEGQKHIVLVHPTVNNLKTFKFLTENKIFPLPDGYRVVGVYPQEAGHDYGSSYDFVEEHGLENYAFLGLEQALQTEDIYRENDLSGQFRRIFDSSEGIFFFGGWDMPPRTYEKPTSLLTVIGDPHRHYMELSLLFHLMGGYQDESFEPWLEEDPEFSILGLCLGMQTMNVAAGGTLYQDIPSEIYGLTTVEEVLEMDQNQQHRNYYRQLQVDDEADLDGYHQVSIEEGSHMANIAGNASAEPFVYTSHHQAVKKIGKGFEVTATATDGKVVEAIEHKEYPNVIGVQFHPEVRRLFKDDVEISIEPGETTGKSFFKLYPGDKGETFHKNFWEYLAKMYPGN